MEFFNEIAFEVRQDLLQGSLNLSFNPASDGLPLHGQLEPLCKLTLPDVFQVHALVRVVQRGEYLGDSLHARGEVGGFDALQLGRQELHLLGERGELLNLDLLDGLMACLQLSEEPLRMLLHQGLQLHDRRLIPLVDVYEDFGESFDQLTAE